MDKFSWKPLLLACLIVSVGQLSLGLVFPSLPWIAKDLAITADQTQLLVSGYLLMFGASQLIYGPLSDVFGRRPVLLSGLTIAMVGLVIVVGFSSSFTGLLIGRILQGFGVGSVSVLARATMRDSYQNQNFVKAMTWVSIVAAFTPIIGPVIGGMVNHYLGWHSLFVLLLVYVGVIWLLLMVMFKETLSQTERPQSVKVLALSYFSLLRERHFMSFAAIGWVNFTLVVLSISLMPFIMQVQIGMSSDEYALWAMMPAVGLLSGGLLCQRVRPRLGTMKMLYLTPLLHLLAGLIFIVMPLSPYTVSGGHFLLAMANGMAFPCAQSILLQPYADKAGTVSALSGAGQMIIASIISSLLLHFGISQLWHLGSVLLAAVLIGWSLVFWGSHSVSGQQAAAALN
ncbi:MFS transporter [Photobacterium jeanii]|uniref:Bcr/CflA family efflux transporter n=1 Tax=Photobacterium jeanii TaxID=858640 RepID=A0A178KAQ2_9GAMM|nr:multidrug effflux MFS transporter [Photobacterium jeanii]OAN14045.1 MFS transporter [Photobacterium jeanii]PST86942.1 MFS transporter [Photobacterium jeanii]